MVVEDKLYAVGGQGAGGDKIEVLDLNDVQSAWQSIPSDLFEPRQNPCIVALSSKEIVILGGIHNGTYRKDVLGLNVQTNKLRMIKKQQPFGFCSILGNN